MICICKHFSLSIFVTIEPNAYLKTEKHIPGIGLIASHKKVSQMQIIYWT